MVVRVTFVPDGHPTKQPIVLLFVIGFSIPSVWSGTSLRTLLSRLAPALLRSVLIAWLYSSKSFTDPVNSDGGPPFTTQWVGMLTGRYRQYVVQLSGRQRT